MKAPLHPSDSSGNSLCSYSWKAPQPQYFCGDIAILPKFRTPFLSYRSGWAMKKFPPHPRGCRLKNPDSKRKAIPPNHAQSLYQKTSQFPSFHQYPNPHRAKFPPSQSENRIKKTQRLSMQALREWETMLCSRWTPLSTVHRVVFLCVLLVP